VVVENGVDFDGDVILRDEILLRDLDDGRTQIDAHDLLYEGDDEDQTRAAHGRESAECKEYAAFVLTQNLDRRSGDCEKYEDDEDRDEEAGKW
jgi:hypothetical protein